MNIQIILETVRQAGELFLKEYKLRPIPSSKKHFFEELNAIEKRCMIILRQGLINECPDIPWNSIDEFDSDGQKKPLPLAEYWICDAMDGAIQYLQHIPGWTINLALIRNGDLHFSAIYDPLSDEMFWAQHQAGAFMNGRPIHPSSKTEKDIMLAVFEYGHQKPAIPGFNQKHGATVAELLNRFGAVRNYGPHGLQLAYVGAGRIDIFHQLGLDTFNWLAGILIAREAGADILNAEGNPWKWGDESLAVCAPDIARRYLFKMGNPEVLK